jgi:hypothetical protein
MRLFLSFIISLFVFTNLSAEDRYVLYGFKIGQKIESAKTKFGEPFKTEKFDDGFTSLVYKLNNSYIVFEINPSAPDLIWGIQSSGTSNPENCGLMGVNLGDPVSKIEKVFGKPDEKKPAIDEITKEEIPGTDFYSYNTSSNFSLETEKGKVSSIKINAEKPKESKDAAPFESLIDMCKKKDYYGLAEMLAPDMYISKDRSFNQINCSMLDSLTKDELFKTLFFDKTKGIASINKNTKQTRAMRIFQSGDKYPLGDVIKIDTPSLKYEIVFVKGFEGWVIWEINIFGSAEK